MTVPSAVPMGRKRTRDFDLPPRMYRRGERYYYVNHVGRWIPLGKSLEIAKRKWADFECCDSAGTVSALCERYLSECMGKDAPSTRKQYRSFANRIEKEWGDLPADLLTAPQLARWRDSGVPPGAANGVLSVLRVAYAKAVEWGWAAVNPAAGVAFNEMPTRQRYLTDTEFRAIRAAAPAWMKIAMDIAYLTAMRPSDVLALRWSQVGDAMVTRTQKTSVVQGFPLSDELLAVLQEAKARPILGLYVVATDKGRPVSLGHWQDVWREICTAASIDDAQIRDIRKKSATDAEREGLDYQALLGHTERKMSDRYIAGTRVIRAPAHKRRI